jgi:hypothetical protein
VNGPGCTFPSSLGVKLVHGQEIYLRLPEVILLLIALRYDRPMRHKNEVICFGAPHYGTPAQGSPIVVCCWAIKSVAHDVAFQRSTRTRESQHHSIRPETFDQTCRAHRIVQHETEVGIFLLASIALIMVTSPSYKNRNGHLPKESGAAAELSATSGQRLIVHNPVRGIQQFVAGKLRTAQTMAAKDANPVALWKAVKRGSVNAEVALANLYLEGEAVPQNCEQGRMLLSAASTKAAKPPITLLKSSYAERCE